MIGIGRKKASDSAVDKLVDCHERIRRFTGIAVRLAGTTDAPDAQIVEAAEAVRRYFVEALPRHAADEDESVAPRLRGRDEGLDVALDRMTRDHVEHEPALNRLIEICTTLTKDPGALERVRQELTAVSTKLETMFVEHLKLEEETIFVAMKKYLDADTLRLVSEEMAARRGR